MYYYSFIIVILIIILIITPVIWIRHHRNSKKKATGANARTTKSSTESTRVGVGLAPTQENAAPQEIPLRTSHNFSKQCIRLLGDFEVRDKNGDNISNLFSKKLKCLLNMLILSTGNDPAGISGEDINNILWPNKNRLDARNNRNVSLTKLRNILEKVGDISIINQGNHWSVVFGKDVLCDYNEIMAYYQAITENKLQDESQLTPLLNMLCRGALLSQTNTDWFNHHKGRFSYQTVEILASLLNHPGITNNTFRIRIANTLLQHDFIHEEALRTKCMLLHESGKHEEKKSCFDEFCTNHFNLLGVHYEKTLKQVLSDGELKE